MESKNEFEDSIQNVLNHVPQMMWEMDGDGQFLYGNVLWRNYIGPCLSPITDAMVVHPSDFGNVMLRWKHIVDEGLDTFEIERRLRNGYTGNYTWFLTRANKVKDRDDRVVWIGTCTNIQNLKSLQEQVLKSQTWWQVLANVVPVMVWTADHTGRMTYFNDRWFKVVGEGQHDWTMMVHPDDVEQVKNVWLESVNNKVSFYHRIFRLWNITTSSYRWVESQAVHVEPLMNEGTSWIGATVDIHDLTEAIERKRNVEYMFNLLSENLPVIIYATDKQGKVIMVVGKAFESMAKNYGFGIGDDMYEITRKFSPEDTSMLDEVLNNGKDFTFQKEIFDKIMRVSWLPTRRTIDGEITGLLGISIDITEEQLAVRERADLAVREQVALESNRVKTQFLANMSHELRTPLNGILGMSELLLQTKLDEEQLHFVSNITSNVTYLTSLVNDIIDIARIESGRLDIQILPFDIRSVVKEIVDNFQVTARDKGIELSYTVNIADDKIVVSDPVRVRQILWNLVSNAIKFTMHGSVKVDVESTMGEKEVLDLVVQDTGIGMSESVQLNLFKPFTQGEASNTRRFSGTGLGLFITKLILEKMNGEIEVNSKEDIGTTMTVHLPVTLEEKTSSSTDISESVSEKEVISASALNGKHVLVAEDNVVNQIIVKRALEHYGVIVYVAPNGKDAVDYYNDHSADIDLILMDIQMPIMDGFEALHHIKDTGSEVPIVAMTASAMKEDIERSYKEGMTDHISKPFRSEELVRTVAKNLFINGTGAVDPKKLIQVKPIAEKSE